MLSYYYFLSFILIFVRLYDVDNTHLLHTFHIFNRYLRNLKKLIYNKLNNLTFYYIICIFFTNILSKQQQFILLIS
ncbi:hypothetical protein TSEDIMI_10062 [Tenacibaculum sediminilitoris]